MMRFQYFSLKAMVFLSLIAFYSCNNHLDKSSKALSYPKTAVCDSSDNYFGTIVKDPFRWLEDDYSPQTQQWVDDQMVFTQNYLNTIPEINDFKSSLEKLWNYEQYSCPEIYGGYYYYQYNNGVENQNSLLRSLHFPAQNKEEIETIINPNTDSASTNALGNYNFSSDGAYLAYAINKKGSDWQSIKIKNLKTLKDLPEELNWAKFTQMQWHKEGFYYSAYDAPTENEKSALNSSQKVYYHRLNSDQKEDKLVYSNPSEQNLYYFAHTSDDQKSLIINVEQGTSGSEVLIKPISLMVEKFVKVTQNHENDFVYITSNNNWHYFLNNKEADNYKLSAVKIVADTAYQWMDIVPESDLVLKNCFRSGDALALVYMENAVEVLKIFDLDGHKKMDVHLKNKGAFKDVFANKSNKEIYCLQQSFYEPGSIFSVHSTTGKLTDLYQTSISFDKENYVVDQVFYPSKDGTPIPVFLLHKKGIKKNGRNPTILYGYGGFNISLTPWFSPGVLPWLEQGGIYAIANLRGGGEFGEAWHKAGMLSSKQNVFDDFISGAEFLIQKGYTSKEKLAISGRSNGGLLVGACMTQRPDLFDVALPGVGVLDMLRYQYFTVGWGWAVEYGASSDSTAFKYLMDYSPYHNIKPGTSYPSTMIITADHDDRVVPAHSFKFGAQLQQSQKGDRPILMRIDKNAGHGAGKPKDKKVQEWADLLGFTWHELHR